MANINAEIKIIEEPHDNEPAPPIAGGPYRPSKRVDLEQFSRIRRRQELNVKLLERSCGQDGTPTTTYEQEDIDLLLQIARERDPNGNPAIRGRAIHALGQSRSVEAAELLWQIASSNREHEAARGQALHALAHVAPQIAPALLSGCLNDKSTLIRQETVNALAETGDWATVELLRELLKREQDNGVRQRAAIAIRSIEERLNPSVDRVKPAKRARKPRKPEREE